MDPLADHAAFSQTIDLMHAAREGDRCSIERFVAKYQDRVLARIRLMMGPEARLRAESQDFLQDTFMAVCRHRPVADEEELLRLIVVIARNQIRGAVRRKRERALESLSGSLDADRREQATPSQEAHEQERIHALVAAIEGLKAEYRTVVELRNLEELPFGKVARLMGKSEAAIHMLHARAMVKLGEKLKSHDAH